MLKKNKTKKQVSGWICPMDHSLPTPALEDLDSGIPHWLAGSFSELCCGLRLFLPKLSIFPFFPGVRPVYSCSPRLPHSPSSFILHRGRKYDVMEITMDWPQKIRDELFLCYFLPLWPSTLSAYLGNALIPLCLPESIVERTYEKANHCHSRYYPRLAPHLNHCTSFYP